MAESVTDKVSRTFKSPTELVRAYLAAYPQGGLFIPAAKPLDLWREVDLRFTLPPDQDTIVCRAMVVWVNGPGGSQPVGNGLIFISMDPADHHKLEDYLRSWGSQDESMAGRLARLFSVR